AEATLAAEHETPQIGAGGGGGLRRQRQPARSSPLVARAHQHEPGDEVVDAAVAERLLPRRARYHPAADRRQLPRLRQVAESEAVRAERRLDARSERAGAEGGKPRLAVE